MLSLLIHYLDEQYTHKINKTYPFFLTLFLFILCKELIAPCYYVKNIQTAKRSCNLFFIKLFLFLSVVNR